MTPAPRIVSSRDLGRSRWRLDAGLGALAVAPLVLLAVLAPAGWVPPSAMRTAAAIWTSCLLAFFSGVRRGLTFSERGGGRPAEIATMLGLFALAVISMLFRSLPLGALGLAAVGGLDAWSGARGEAPAYFRSYRPVQMGVAVLALLALCLELRTAA